MPDIATPHLAIDARGLTRRFGTVAAIDGVDLAVQQGEVFGLIGADGAGKTTVLRVLCGVLKPDRGEASVAGQDVLRNPEGVKRRIGYLSQAFSLYADLTVEENIDFCADLYCTPRSEVKRLKEDMLAMTDLADFRRRLAGRLSGGMKQKLALLCALIHRPRLLLLDEPTTGVDPVSRRDFWRILYQLPQQGVTVLISTPYMDEASRCARLAFMYEGRLLAYDTPEQLRASSPSSYLELRCEGQRQARALLQRLPEVQSVEVFGDRLHVALTPGAAPALLTAALREAGLGCQECTPVSPSLEDVFMELSRRPSAG